MLIKPGLEDEYKQYVEVNKNDMYSRAIVDWGEDMARVLESKLEEGKQIPDCMREALRQTDDGYTGFMYDCMISALGKFWLHGDEVLKWHNREHIPDQAKADALTAAHRQVSTAIFEIGTPDAGAP